MPFRAAHAQAEVKTTLMVNNLSKFKKCIVLICVSAVILLIGFRVVGPYFRPEFADTIGDTQLMIMLGGLLSPIAWIFGKDSAFVSGILSKFKR